MIDPSKAIQPEEVELFLGLQRGAFDHIPEYARYGALKAIARVRALEQGNLFRPGLYYIVLVDLVASTTASLHLGAEKNRRRVEAFITATVEAFGAVKLESYAQFVREIGDAALFLFSSFNDVLRWWEQAEMLYDFYNQQYQGEISAEESRYFNIKAKTVVHLGEVAFSDRSSPVALAVNQVFKIEKMFTAGQLGATDVVKQAAEPTLIANGLHPTRHQDVVLPEREEPTPTWILATSA